MKRLQDRQPLSPRDYAAQSGELEAELSMVRETRELWLAQAKGIGRDRTVEFQRDIDRITKNLDGLRKRAQRTSQKRVARGRGSRHIEPLASE